jgi:CBS domain-containing protein
MKRVETIKQLLDEKGRDIWSIKPEDTVFDAIKRMAEKRIGALIVLENGKLVGIISERDYARKVILKNKASQDTTVREIMVSPVVCGRPEQTVDECMTLITHKRVRHLPIIDKNQVVGVISIGDLVKSIIAQQQFEIEQLEHYITG